MDDHAEMPMPAMQPLVEVWAVLSESDKTAVRDFFQRWTDIWSKWSGLMAPGQKQHFAAYLNAELTEQVAQFRAAHAKKLAAAASGATR